MGKIKMTVIEVWVLTQRWAITCMLAFQQEEDTFNIVGNVILVSLVGEAIGQGPRNKNLMISETAAYWDKPLSAHRVSPDVVLPHS